MAQCQIQKCKTDDSDLQKINALARRELSADEIYVFNVTLCSNEVDRDYEKFSIESLKQLAPLFIGKTGISDHSMKSSDQKARIFDTYIEKQDGRFTVDGEPLCFLKAKAYMLNNEKNASLIEEIDAGIKKEVSVSCSMSSSKCSVCGNDRKKGGCSHIRGREYNGKLCFDTLSNAADAYEFSFVAVPAQREAGITKSFKFTQEENMQDILKSIENCGSDITISKSQAHKLQSYIDDLSEKASLGEAYKEELSKEVVKMFLKAFPKTDPQIFSSLTSVMTTKELLGFKNGMCAQGQAPAPQLMPKGQRRDTEKFNQYKI